MSSGCRKKRLGYVLDGRICDYGCGGRAYYEFANGKVCCGSNHSKCPGIFVRNETGEWIKKEKKELPSALCECDCGDFAKPGNRFINGHSVSKGRKKRKSRSRRLGLVSESNRICDYGCGKQAGYQFSNGKVCCENKVFKCSGVATHSGSQNGMYGRKHTKESRKLIIIKGKERWKDPEFKIKMLNAIEDPKRREKISKKLKGRIRTKNHCVAISEGKKKKSLKRRIGLVLNPNIICQYGCGRQAYYQFLSNRKFCCSRYTQQCPVVKKKQDVTLSRRKSKGGDLHNVGWKHLGETRRKMRLTALEKISEKCPGERIIPRSNVTACEFFKRFDKDFDTRGYYGSEEYRIKELGYFPDYINFDLKLIIEWDEERHYNADGNLKEDDIQRQKEIQERFSDFRFVRIREKFQRELDYSFMEAGRQE